jgi:alginate O-acetyltransferase complex protein AlgI
LVFNSLAFLLFLPTVLLGYFMLPHKFRWILLLIASYFFYGFWKIEYLSLILFSTVVDFSVSQFLDKTIDQTKRKLALGVSLFTNLGLLFFFKYFNWFLDDVANPMGIIPDNALNYWHSNFQFLLPVGISFYTFQTLGYTIDVYYKKAIPEKNFFKFALFVSYFPQLVAGPIERFSNLQSQLFAKHKFTYENLQNGGRFILYGLFIKMCVADNIANVVDAVFNDIGAHSSLTLFTTMLLFGLQIFSDFHGYSLIAIGTAQLFGVHLMTNFNAPYTATSIREFWSRWHISLSTWFRDYLFIPLGGSRVSSIRWMVNILIIFIVSGFWHGANFTFLAWGAIHGSAYILEKYTWNKTASQHNLIQFGRWVLTMLIVFVAWVFFRADSMEQASSFISSMLSSQAGESLPSFPPILIAFIGFLLLSDLIFKDQNIHEWLDKQTFAARWFVYAIMLYAILGFAGTVNHPFIYFQF